MYCPHCMTIIEEKDKYCPGCGRDVDYKNPESALPVGSVLADRYYVGAVLGQGGFGITYVGCDKRLNKKVAIKEYFPSAYVSRYSEHSTDVSVSAGDAAAAFEHEKDKFIKEAYLLAEFSDDRNVVNVTDIITDHNTAYIVMEYVGGDNLGQFLRKNGKMTFRDALALVMPLMVSLSKIHERGLIHRDISPANIIVQPGKPATLIDFGAARAFDSNDEKSLSVILKHGYAPPEQYQSRGEQGPWTDVYALSATIYKMITGVTLPDSVERVMGLGIKRPSELGAVISPAEENALLRGLSVNPAERYGSMTDLRNALLGMAPVSAPRQQQTYSQPQQTYNQPQQNYSQPQAPYTPTQIVSPQEQPLYRQDYNSEYRSEYSYQYDQPRKSHLPLIALVTAAALLALVAIVSVIAFSGRGDDDYSEEVVERTSDRSRDSDEDSEEEDTKDKKKSEDENTASANEEEETQAETEKETQTANLTFESAEDEFGIVSGTVEDYSNCLEPTSYRYYNSGISDFYFYYPDNFYQSASKSNLSQQTNFGELTESVFFLGSEGSYSYFSIEKRTDDKSLEDMTDYVHQIVNADLDEPMDILVKTTDEYGKVIQSGYTKDTHNPVYSLRKVEKDYVLSMVIMYPEPTDEEDKNMKWYMVDTMYRYCGFSDSTKFPRTYEQYLEGTG